MSGVIVKLWNALMARVNGPMPPLVPESDWLVSLCGDQVQVTEPSGSSQQLDLRDAMAVVIETNDSGPWGADFWWVLSSREQSCSFPQGATGEDAVVARLMRLPGFDFEALGAASCSVENATFEVWRRDAAIVSSTP